MILKVGRIGDAFALLRKYNDSIILNLYTNLYLKKNSSMQKPTVEEVIKWLNNIGKLPHNDYKSMFKYIMNSDELKGFLKIVDRDEWTGLIKVERH